MLVLNKDVSLLIVLHLFETVYSKCSVPNIILNTSQIEVEIYSLRTDAEEASQGICLNDCFFKKHDELITQEGQKWGYCFEIMDGCNCL